MSKIIRKLNDPELENSRLNHKDNFELIYMRHRYFRKSTNPDPKRLLSFEEMICNISNKIYMRNIEVFKTVGLEMDDLRNIGRVHTVSFISMSGLYENPNLMDKFIKKHKKQYGKDSEPGERDIFLQECYNLASFLNQRLQEVALFSKYKNKNIRGTRSYKYYYISDEHNYKVQDMDLYQNPDKYGFSKITQEKYKEILKENKPKNKQAFITKDGQLIRVVYLKGSFLTNEDLEGTDFDRSRSFFYKNPEEVAIAKEFIKKHDIIK